MAPTTRSMALAGSSPDLSVASDSAIANQACSSDQQKGPLFTSLSSLVSRQSVHEQANDLSEDDDLDTTEAGTGEADTDDENNHNTDFEYLRQQSLGKANLQSNLHINAHSSKGKKIVQSSEPTAPPPKKNSTSVSKPPKKKKQKSNYASCPIITHRVGSRCSPGDFSAAIKDLNPDQKGKVKILGFGGLLNIKCSSVFKQLGIWLLQHYNVLIDVIELPNGAFEGGNMDNKFITAFMLITLCKIIAPTTSNQPSMQYANVCLDVDNIAKYNWAEHMLSTIRNAALQVQDKIKKKENIDWISASTYFLGGGILDREAKPLKQADKGSGLYAVYGSCKNVEATYYAKAFEPHKETINMAGLGPYVDLVRQLDDGSFSFEEMEMVKKAITNYAHEHAVINHDYRISVNHAEHKMHEEVSKNTIRLMSIIATVCNNRSTRLSKQRGTAMDGATSTTSMPSTTPTSNNNAMSSICADAHITNAEAPK